MVTEINSEQYRELETKVTEKVTDLNSYDTDDYTSPKEVDELWEKSADFREWVNSILTRSGTLALEVLEDENIFAVSEDNLEKHKDKFTALIKTRGYVGQNGWVAETIAEIDQGNTLLEEKLEPFVDKKVLISIEEMSK